MRILITNDDGINAEGLRVLAEWATKLGEVWVIAPKTQQSAKSHAINIHVPFEAVRVDYPVEGVTAFAVDSTPVDCVRFATLGLHQDYDLVLSGINNGLNMGEDLLYSGTVGAVFEAQLRSTLGVALSTEPGTFEQAASQLDKIYQYFVEHQLLQHNGIYNVNIPAVNKGILLTKQGDAYFTDRFDWVDQRLIKQTGYCIHENHHDLTIDTDATIDGYITITPLTINRSANDVWSKLTNK